jgi:endonuclease YncB( thermonuclease family)
MPTLAYARIRRRLAPIFLLVFLAAAPGPAADFSAKVVGISDGDTLTMLKADKTQVKIRLHGIDAFETGQPFSGRPSHFSEGSILVQDHDALDIRNFF